MGSYDTLKPYPTEYIQFISSEIVQRAIAVFGDGTGLHLGTAVKSLGMAAGRMEKNPGGEVTLMAVAVAWGKMLGLQEMDEFQSPGGTQVPREIEEDDEKRIMEAFRSCLRETGAHRSTWGTLLIIAAMDLIYQARGVISSSIPKTILLSAIADGAKRK